MDERFAGWGYEDTEFLSRLHHSVPGGSMGPSGLPLRELFVPSNRDLRGANLELFSKITTERGW
jgi:predicted glycosyltransferase involved in capsule biosynthesis